MDSTPSDQDREKWQKICEGWQISGLSGKKYCKREKIPMKPFYSWRKQLNFLVPIKVIYNWEEVNNNVEDSGLSVDRYCKEKGIPPSGLYLWRRKINHPAYIKPKERYDEWIEIIKDWEAGSLTQRAYCMRNGLSPPIFNRWERRHNPHKIRKTCHEEAVERWTKIFEDWKESGLSKFTYCQRKGVTHSCFYKWARRLNVLEPIRPDFTRQRPDICLEDHFTPIPFSSDISLGSLPADKKIEITLPQGHHLHIEGQWEGLNAWVDLLVRSETNDKKEI
ncbi:MAG: hypothetical protein H0X26_10255 [Alphaproteobacteria bacterium]|nr:hypothetical protein [Alphaproteobacteria bacterium]